MRKLTYKRAEGFQKRFCGRLERESEKHPEKPLKVMAFDEARFGLINWHRKLYCPKGFRPPRIVRRVYEWTYLYSAVEPSSGESFCMYFPGADGGCFEMYLEELGKAYSDHHLLIVLDNAPSHTSKHISYPERTSAC